MTKTTYKLPLILFAGTLFSSAAYAQFPPYYAPDKPNVEINLEVLRSLAPSGRARAMERYQERAPRVMESRRVKSRPSAPNRPSAPSRLSTDSSAPIGGRAIMNPPPPPRPSQLIQRHTDVPLPRLKPVAEEPDIMTMKTVAPPREPLKEPQQPQTRPPEKDLQPPEQQNQRKVAPLFEKPQLGTPKETVPPLPMPGGEKIPEIPPLPQQTPLNDTTADLMKAAPQHEGDKDDPLPWKGKSDGLPADQLPPLPPTEAMPWDNTEMPEIPAPRQDWASFAETVEPADDAEIPSANEMPPAKASATVAEIPAPVPPAAESSQASEATAKQRGGSIPSVDGTEFEMPPLPKSAQEWLSRDDSNPGKIPEVPALPLETKPVEQAFPSIEAPETEPPASVNQTPPEPQKPLPVETTPPPAPPPSAPLSGNTIPTPDFQPIPMPDFMNAPEAPPAFDDRELGIPSLPNTGASQMQAETPISQDIEAGKAPVKNAITATQEGPFASPASPPAPPSALKAVPPPEEDKKDTGLFAGVRSSFKNLLTQSEPADTPPAEPTADERPPLTVPPAALPTSPQSSTQPSAPLPEDINPVNASPSAGSAPVMPVGTTETPSPFFSGMAEPETATPPESVIAEPPFPDDEPMKEVAVPEGGGLPSMAMLREDPSVTTRPKRPLPSMEALKERENPPPLAIPEGTQQKPLPDLTQDVFETSDSYEVVEKNNVPVAKEPEQEMQVASLPSEPASTAAHPTSLQVVYGVDDTDIPDEDKVRILKLAAGVKDRPNDRIIITAYASGKPEERNAANMISLSRALSLRAFMIDAGVEEQRIVVQAKGLDNPGGEADRAELRVE